MLPNQVRKTVNRITDTRVRDALMVHLNEWETKEKAMSRAIRAGVHRMPVPTRAGAGLTPGGDTASVYFFSPSTCLDWMIELLAKKYIRSGWISKRDHREYEKYFIRSRY